MALSVLLHLLFVGWAGSRLTFLQAAPQVTGILTAELLSLPPAPVETVLAAPVAAVLPTPKPPRKPTPRPAPKLPAPTVSDDALASAPGPATSNDASAPLPEEQPVSRKETTMPDAVETLAATESSAAPPAPALPTFKVKPPPSAALTYDVHALRDGKDWYGSGDISWRSDGTSYQVTGAASVSALVFKITALNFWSKGQIDDFGVAPLLYSETRFRKAETNTHFRHAPDIISFSASTVTYPRTGGAQDRASIMWQLASIGNGDPDKFMPGADFDVFVAGVRDAETWRIRVIGEEKLSLGIGTIDTWHVSRAPRSGSYEQKIDIWLAPRQHWYPVRILYTEANGDYLDMSLSRLDAAIGQ